MRKILLAVLLILPGCSNSPSGPQATGELQLEVTHAGCWDPVPGIGKRASASRMDVVLRQEGGTPDRHAMSRRGAAWRCEIDVAPAAYTVMVEAYDGDRVRWSGATSATVESGRTATARIQLYETTSAAAVAQLLETNACTGCDLRGAVLQGHYLRQVNLRGADLDGANLALSHLQYANLREASLRNAYLIGASIRYADLQSADLRGANASEANFTEAKMLWTNLASADLLRVVFDKANLENANFEGANITGASFVGARLGGATWTGGERCPPGFVGTAQTGTTASCLD